MEKRRGSVWITWIFLAFVFLIPAAKLAVPDKAYSDTENRYLAGKPEFSWENLLDGSYGASYDAYLSDQFPGRNSWVGIKVLAERLAGKRDVNGVYIGKDGYLLERFDKEEIETGQLRKYLERLADFSLEAGRALGEEHVRIMLVPSASQILKDKLPALAAPYDQSRVPGLLKRLIDERGEAGMGRKLVVDVETPLLENQAENLYYRTDHHWTSKGAYTGYAAWAKSAGIEPWPESAFRRETVSREFYGTVYSKLNIPWRADEIELYIPGREQEYRVFYDGNSQGEESLYDRNALVGKDKYSVFLGGNHGLVKIVNRTAGEEGSHKKLLLVRDSFANSFAPFAAGHFGTVYLADLRYLNVNLAELAREEGVTDVLVLYQIPGFSQEKTVSKLKWR